MGSLDNVGAPSPADEKESVASARTFCLIGEKTPPHSVNLPSLPTPRLCRSRTASTGGVARASFRVPMLDGGRSPFGDRPLLQCAMTDGRSELMGGLDSSNGSEPSPPQHSPTPGRRPAQFHRYARAPGAAKLPPLETPTRSKKMVQLPECALRTGSVPDDGVTPFSQDVRDTRGCHTAPASRQSAAFFTPVPPFSDSPASASRTVKTPKLRSLRRRSTFSVGMGHGAVANTGLTPSVKSGTSALSTPSTSEPGPSDLAELQLVTPASSSAMATPGSRPESLRSADSSRQTRNQLQGTFPLAKKITRWRKGEKIGAGSHGCVYKAQDLSNGHLFVVKESIVNDKEYHDKLRRELDICKDLEHRNIVRCLGHEYCEGHQSVLVYLEYASGGSLRCILNEFGPLEEAMMIGAMSGLLEGLEYLHTRNPPVVHRDIKSANVLAGQDFVLKLADFGCSKRDDTTQSFTTTGSVLWMAPEVIRGLKGGHGRKADIWSLGCVFIEMATAEKPWGNNAFDNILQAMKHIEGSGNSPPIPDALSSATRDLISQCVRRDASQRPRATDLLMHDIFHDATN